MQTSEQDFKHGFAAGQADKLNDRPHVERFGLSSLAYRAGYRAGYFKSLPGSKPEYKWFYDDWMRFLYRPSL